MKLNLKCGYEIKKIVHEFYLNTQKRKKVCNTFFDTFLDHTKK